jgi:B12-binding domain/radical SAM domain protein of rhizo-twelve system
MKVALINPPWSFDGSIYFGCRDPHLPLELGYAKARLEAAGHDVTMRDGHLEGLSQDDLAQAVADFAPDMTVMTTAPTYLFWRCAQPELRIPQEMAARLGDAAGRLVAIGPHGSTTPEAALRKLAADVVVMGESEEAIAALADGADAQDQIVGTCVWRDGEPKKVGGPLATRFTDTPALIWPEAWVRRHGHHHHRFDRAPDGPGAEVEASRGCPYACSFCAKENFRDKYRRRDLPVLLEEIDRLIDQGAVYLYFVDEIFLPWKQLLEALVEREVAFGIQTRIDLWKPSMVELLGRAGCVSIEAGVESLTEEGRDSLDKDCRMTTEDLAERLVVAKRNIPFVQANLIETPQDDARLIAEWRDHLRAEGVWANDPVPLFPYPGSPDYRKLWGFPDERAWERALDYYLEHYVDFSDIQEDRPLPLDRLERPAA